MVVDITASNLEDVIPVGQWISVVDSLQIHEEHHAIIARDIPLRIDT
ncbi:MAG: hypothetical protein WCU88_05195 [Elusimicrobiota bacterium]